MNIRLEYARHDGNKIVELFNTLHQAISRREQLIAEDADKTLVTAEISYCTNYARNTNWPELEEGESQKERIISLVTSYNSKRRKILINTKKEDK